MTEYETWVEEWAKSDKKADEKDQAINRVTEEFFITLIHALEISANPELLTQSVRFLDTKVPPEFDEVWRFVFIEITNVARDGDGRPLRSEHLENLKRRAMNSK